MKLTAKIFPIRFDALSKKILIPFWPHLFSYQSLIWILFVGRYFKISEISFHAWLTVTLINSLITFFLFFTALTPLKHDRDFLSYLPSLYWGNSLLTYILFYALTFKGQELVIIPFIALIIVSAYYSPHTTKIRYLYLILFLGIFLRYIIWPQLIQDKFTLIREWIYLLAISTIPIYTSALAVRRQKNYELIERLLAANRKSVRELNRMHQELAHNHDLTINKNKDMERDLAKAKSIQQQLLPKQLPQGFESNIATIYQPANQVGGDFYDIRINSKNNLMVFIADVFGHGVPAALVASMTKIVLDNIKWYELNPSRVLEKLNHDLFNKTANLLISAFIVEIDFNSYTLTYANAGHLYPFLIGAKRSQMCEAQGPLLGIFSEPMFKENKTNFAPQDSLLLYTDGATDIHNDSKSSLGEDMFIKLAQKMERDSVNDWLANIYRAIQLYSGNHQFEDDITLIGIQL